MCLSIHWGLFILAASEPMESRRMGAAGVRAEGSGCSSLLDK